jgi:hypothetical protein
MICGPAKAGIALADCVERCHIVGNHLFEPNSPGGSTDDYAAAILL